MDGIKTATATVALFGHHAEDLRRSGLSEEQIGACGFYSEGNHHKLSAILDSPYSKRCGSALVFPFRDTDGNLNGYKRLKPDIPRKDRNGKPIKYESPRKTSNRAFFPPKTFAVLDDPQAELLVVEGEKKAAKADQEGFACIGLVGVFGWKHGKTADRLIPDLEAVEWSGRKVIIVFDSDLAEKPGVQDAESRLAAQLQNRGAVVRVARLPDGPGGEKVGVDDFLVANDAAALRKLLDRAGKPEPSETADEKIPANQLDAMPEARRFLKQVATHADGCALKFWQGEFWVWGGKRYQQLDDNEVRGWVIRYLDRIASHISKSVVTNILACAQAETILGSNVEFPCWLEGGSTHRNHIATENGILDVDSFLAGEIDSLQPHSPLWFSPVSLPYPFDFHAGCPKWLAFLDRNLEGDSERIQLLQQWFGYCLTNDTTHQKFMVFEGEGSNGKSVVCAVLAAVLGADNVSHTPLESFGLRFSLNRTVGKLANIASEVGELDRVAEGFLKSFTSGDRMQFERKFKEPIESKPTARLVLATNNRPRFSDRSGGLWRRMILVPFRVAIPENERVRGMDQLNWWKDQGELPGIFNWALAGLFALRNQQRFTESSLCKEALAEYRQESNPARLFLTSNYTEDVNGDIVTADVYKSYREWCEINGYRPLASNTFGKEIVRVFTKAKPAKVISQIGQRVRGYQGIAASPE